MQLIQIKFGTELHDKEIKLRDQVLRAPLGLRFKKEDLESEKDELRYGLLDSNGKLTACLLVRILDDSVAKIRQMAVKEELRGKGLGRELMKKVESELKKKKFNKIELHARMYAKGFYDKLGYSPTGKEFSEIGIPHVKMVKDINA
ncbi:MAG: GNAT family N-acetyltransferase [Acidobacteriota bacterium]